MSTISKPNDFTASTTISSSEVNDNFDTIYNDYNGGISAANLATSAVSTAKIADSAVTTAKINDLGVTNGKINTGAVTYDKAAAGFSVQTVKTNSTAVDTTTTTIPYDDTIPQITEGKEFMTLAITPKATTNILVIQITAVFGRSGTGGNATMALFQDATADALAAVPIRFESTDATNIGRLTYTMAAGTTSSTTFRMRAGPTGNTLTFNGAASARLYGAITKSSMVITEYNA